MRPPMPWPESSVQNRQKPIKCKYALCYLSVCTLLKSVNTLCVIGTSIFSGKVHGNQLLSLSLCVQARFTSASTANAPAAGRVKREAQRR